MLSAVSMTAEAANPLSAPEVRTVGDSIAMDRQMEKLTRGVLVANVGSGVLVSWRLLGTESPDTEFNLYRDGKKIASIGKNDGNRFVWAEDGI